MLMAQQDTTQAVPVAVAIDASVVKSKTLRDFSRLLPWAMGCHFEAAGLRLMHGRQRAMNIASILTVQSFHEFQT